VETLQEQLTVVNAKIEAIHQKIEVISTQIAELLGAVRPSFEQNNRASIRSNRQDIESSGSITHRDILADEGPTALSAAKGQTISHELQMQRLMAQLTAAYNRIAALEEQLLSQRLP
jgi:chromosome segregation ATPase